MDWDYILSISPEDLTEEEKDDLYNTVTWYNCDHGDLNMKKAICLIKISQEVLKYKGEQVEILLHKLDELATQQGEEEIKKLEVDTDARSSRKSSSIEFENLEQKYLELKNKYKKLVRTNEKNSLEINKFQKKVADLEREKTQLINEMQLINQDDNQSDVSESVKEQHKELLVTLHNKNMQISDLLHDIEETEKENIVLREKLTNVRDELATATKELTVLTENLKASQVELEESSEMVKKLTAENENLQEEMREIMEQKQKFELEMEEFTEEVNLRVDEWKKILEEKENEISELRLRPLQTSHHSSTSSLLQDTQQSHMSTLNKILVERENQLMELKTQLQEAAKEMEETTSAINELNSIKDDYERQISGLTESVKELKKQLKTSHERCQDLQNNLTATEKLAASKDADIEEILEKLKNEGEVELSTNLGQIQQLKNKTRAQEQQIIHLVKSTNKLQDLSDRYQQENQVLREKMGISSEDTINTSGLSLKQKQQKKELHSLKKRLAQLEEEQLEMKMHNHKLNRTVATLNNQLIKLGENPDTVNEFQGVDSDISTKNQTRALIEENEALRKGMHEILDSLNIRKETSLKEINSETFEKLLRALDVKHISGWYHPAMRLQAELHNLQGINSELREQLRLTKLEKKLSIDMEKSKDRISEDVIDSISVTENLLQSDAVTINAIHNKLQQLFIKLEHESAGNDQIEGLLISYKENFLQLRQQISLLYEQYLKEKQSYIDKMSEYEERILDLEESNAIKDEKLQLLTKEEDGKDSSLVSRSLELAENNVVLLRKCSYWESEVKNLRQQISNLQNDLTHAQTACLKKIGDLSKKNKALTNSVNILTNQIDSYVEPDDYNSLLKNFEDITAKYRDLLQSFEESSKNREFEFRVMKEMNNNLLQGKSELESKIVDLLEKLHCYEHTSESNDTTVKNISKKLAESEKNEISERQRANHTNNLFELVKEQLQKSEERCKQVETYNKEVLQKNLLLQEQLKDAENKLCNFIDVNSHKCLQTKYNELVQLHEQINLSMMETKEELAVLKNNHRFTVSWNSEREQELLNLKHQIVDLQATTDEKMQIARLSTELLQMRQQEAEYKRKIDDLTTELENSYAQCEELSLELKRKTSDAIEKDTEMKKRIGILRSIVEKNKLQYLKCVPLPSEEKFVNNIRKAISDKHEAFLNLYNAQIVSSESSVLKEHYEKELKNIEQVLKSNNIDVETIREVMCGYKDKRTLQFNEIKYKRHSQLKETQLQHIFDRVKIQDEQIIKLEEELFALHKNVSFDCDTEAMTPSQPQEKFVKTETPIIILNKSREIQTDDIPEERNTQEETCSSLRSELITVNNDVALKEQTIQQLKSKITELEMNISLFRKQLGDKQSQIIFYERHILELQGKKEVAPTPTAPEVVTTNDEILTLKCSLRTVQDNLKLKEEEVLRYQTLLKEDRDKHSMAATLMRDELKVLQKCLSEEKQKVLELQSSSHQHHPSKAALDQYFLQVHTIEDELSNFRTRVSGLESQLQASRQEAVRWRTLANDRLESMQTLGKELEDLHRNELNAYKNDAEKWREEVTNLKQLIGKYRSEMGHEFDFQKILKERDDRIHELTVMLRQVRTEAKKNVDKSDTESVSRLNELESTKEQLVKEHETIKKRFDQLLMRERSAREEIRDLKSKLMKKPILSARSDRSDRSIKEQLQKKISSLENEIVDLKENLAKQVAINESHRIKISEDFDRWNKQKHWQQTAEKLKNKLKSKEGDFEKLQQTCAGYRILIERLEREKYNLENRIRSLKTSNSQLFASNEIETLRLENMKLISENELLTSKLEMQQHHAGGLGAAMLQEKLEAQERKIAILELSAKGTLEVRTELERLQNTVSSLQKANLCLEAENLEYKLDLEQSSKELPHLREQIHHLENYIEVLKKENAHSGNNEVEALAKADSKKVSELERTIFVLKRVVEKLQVENKRLLTGKRPFSDRPGLDDKLKRDHQRLKEQYCESIEKVAKLEKELSTMKATQNKPVSNNIRVLSDELAQVKEQLEQKSQLLNKVKVLLRHAAIKEKALLDEINQLKMRSSKEPTETSSNTK